MDFKQLQSFVTVVECGSFSRAAASLFVSQPTISAHIRALEEELCAQLITRTTKRIEVTRKGRSVYHDARGILEIRDRMVRLCSEDEKLIIRIAASTIPASYILPEILPEFGRLYPKMYFSIHRAESREVLEGVMQGRFDLGFSTKPGDEHMISLPVCRDRMVLITPVNDYFLSLHGKKEVSQEELQRQPIILREKSETKEKQADVYLKHMDIDEGQLEVVARVNDQETVKNLVAGGMGVSRISQRAARDFMNEKRILCFELPVKSEKMIYFVVRKKDWQIEHIQHFARFVQKSICGIELDDNGV